jgi:DNA-binding response OmpR family regulator
MTTLRSDVSVEVKGKYFNSTMLPARIVWLRQHCHQDPAALRLQRQLQMQDLELEIISVSDVTDLHFSTADLVMLDACERMEGIAEILVPRIRMETQVPLVMVTNCYSTEQLVMILTLGVDAIWSLDTSLEVLMARCRALLRRCFMFKPV